MLSGGAKTAAGAGEVKTAAGGAGTAVRKDKSPLIIPAARAISTFKCFSGELAGASFDLRCGESIMIGRDPAKSNIVLSGRTISRQHCEIRYNAVDKCAMVKDLSANGVTFLDGTALPKNRFVNVKSGEGIRLGNNGEVFLFS
jgi:hypothetical protein